MDTDRIHILTVSERGYQLLCIMYWIG